MNEEWKPITNYNGYFVSNLGRIKSKKSTKELILKQIKQSRGYFYVNLYNENGTKPILVHRVVAQAFVDTYDSKKEVNHVDGNKENNRADNLEWVTRRENQSHAIGGALGCHYRKDIDKWQSRIRINGHLIHLGYFDTKQEANKKYKSEMSNKNIKNKYAV